MLHSSTGNIHFKLYLLFTIACICIELTDHQEYDYYDDVEDAFTDYNNFTGSLDNCNCGTFWNEWIDQLELNADNTPDIVSQWNGNADIICCQSNQLSDLNRLTATEWSQLESASEIFLNKVINPYLLFDRVTALHLFSYQRSNVDDMLITVNCRIRHLFVHHSFMQPQVLDQIAQNCLHLKSIHLDLRLELPIQFDRFNILTRNFASQELAVVNLINCQIRTLTGIDLFWNATNIQMISLSRNHIFSLNNSERFFPSSEAKNWWSLDLSYNYLRTLPVDFVFPASLRVLKLDHNQLKVMPFAPFKRVWHNLNEFWIQYNSFECAALANSTDWMHALAERIPPIGNNWICYHSNSTKRMFTQELLSQISFPMSNI